MLSADARFHYACYHFYLFCFDARARATRVYFWRAADADYTFACSLSFSHFQTLLIDFTDAPRRMMRFYFSESAHAAAR